MKILLVVPRYSLTNVANYEYYLPLGLAYISASLKKAGHDVHCLNLNHLNGNSDELINNSLNNQQYDFVCTGNNALGYTITDIILTTARNHPSKPKTILGGPIVTSEPDLIFNALKPDYAVIGEGEEIIVELLEHIEKNKDLSNVKGIVYFNKENQITKTPKREPPSHLDTLPYPDFEGLGFNEWLNNLHPNMAFSYNVFDYPKVYPILGSRSCPFQCTFCYHEGKYRSRHLKNIMEEITFAVKKYKINLIVMYDEVFAIEKQKLYEFCKKINKLSRIF